MKSGTKANPFKKCRPIEIDRKEMECGVCCSSTDKMVQCVECQYQACRSCVQAYLVSITRDPHCMNCRHAWDILCLRKNLDKTFWEGAYQEHRRRILEKRSHRCQDKDVLCACPLCPCGKVPQNTHTCLSCGARVCPRCHQEDGCAHTCPEDQVRSLETITQTTRPCPGCHAPIEKKSGCFQMFCTHCYTAFDWKDGRFLEKTSLHNPHYFDHQETTNNQSALHHRINNMTDYPMKWVCREFCILVRDIGRQAQSIPYQQDDAQLCQYLIWVKYYKRGLTILHNLMVQPPIATRSQIQCFKNDLREVLIDYNEHVAECVQLRGYRLFPCNPPVVCT